ncbi:hypothetical protein DFH07DRAFT_768724 [Mycena maculata]|uniref:Uncharacterized protein n=1 Tax=Mycena maculata TaxID=230809 RepID=A0AAD7JTL9_9AGAR|nr:hypothetical protein DFH07DRAFT_768724 [Mycena maculata]
MVTDLSFIESSSRLDPAADRRIFLAALDPGHKLRWKNLLRPTIENLAAAIFPDETSPERQEWFQHVHALCYTADAREAGVLEDWPPLPLFLRDVGTTLPDSELGASQKDDSVSSGKKRRASNPDGFLDDAERKRLRKEAKEKHDAEGSGKGENGDSKKGGSSSGGRSRIGILDQLVLTSQERNSAGKIDEKKIGFWPTLKDAIGLYWIAVDYSLLAGRVISHLKTSYGA